MRKKMTQDSEPFQIRWEREQKIEFEKLVKEYDSYLPLSTAILKLIHHAITEHWLPGYERKHRKLIEGGDYRPQSFDRRSEGELESTREEMKPYGKTSKSV